MTSARTAGPTASHPQIHGFDGFTRAVSSSFVPLEVSSRRKDRFRGLLQVTEADRYAFVDISASAHEVHRRPERISGDDEGYYKVSVLLAGTGLLVQDHREVVLQAGDLAIYDTTRPYSLVFDDEFRNFVFLLPKDALEIPATLVRELTATRLPRDSATGALLASFLPHVPSAITHSPESVRARLGRSAVDLLDACLSSTLGAERLDQDPRQVLLRKVRRYIEAHLQSPDLGPARIAAAHYMSTRRLHGLFQGERVSVAALIRSQRLERCRSELMSPAHADQPVSAIAAKWGFTDAAHFSRVFRSRFGVCPREIREQR